MVYIGGLNRHYGYKKPTISSTNKLIPRQDSKGKYKKHTISSTNRRIRQDSKGKSKSSTNRTITSRNSRIVSDPLYRIKPKSKVSVNTILNKLSPIKEHPLDNEIRHDNDEITDFISKLYYITDGDNGHKVLGTGSFGTCYLCCIIKSDTKGLDLINKTINIKDIDLRKKTAIIGNNTINIEIFALKQIEIVTSTRQISLIEKEISILRSLKHNEFCLKFTLCFRGVAEYNGKYYILTDYASEDYKTLSIKYLNTKILENIYNAIKNLHKTGIAHLDIKPNNILYNSKNNKVIIIDFGASCNNTNADTKTTCPNMNSLIYTPMYLDFRLFLNLHFNAELIYKTPPTFKEFMDADLWAFGIICNKYVNREEVDENDPLKSGEDIFDANKYTLYDKSFCYMYVYCIPNYDIYKMLIEFYRSTNSTVPYTNLPEDEWKKMKTYQIKREKHVNTELKDMFDGFNKPYKNIQSFLSCNNLFNKCLIDAVTNGNIQIVNLLISNNLASPNILTEDGISLLEHALIIKLTSDENVQIKCQEIIDYLLGNESVDKKLKDGYNEYIEILDNQTLDNNNDTTAGGGKMKKYVLVKKSKSKERFLKTNRRTMKNQKI